MACIPRWQSPQCRARQGNIDITGWMLFKELQVLPDRYRVAADDRTTKATCSTLPHVILDGLPDNGEHPTPRHARGHTGMERNAFTGSQKRSKQWGEEGSPRVVQSLIFFRNCEGLAAQSPNNSLHNSDRFALALNGEADTF